MICETDKIITAIITSVILSPKAFSIIFIEINSLPPYMKSFLPSAALFLSINAFAQLPCGTETQYKKIVEKNPHAAVARQQLQEFSKNYKATAQRSANTVKIIPVVFHIIHTYGAENISKSQVLDAVRVINEDFQKMNADTSSIVNAFKPIAADCQVEFRLAGLDPNGNCTDGITRTYSLLTHNADDNVKELISWDNDKYLNIWVVNSISFNAGGYAYYPGTAPPGGEGIVVLHTQLGSIGTSCGLNFCSRTLTHEIGHYLNLPHTWGSNNDCGNASACMDDDGISDTPNTNGACQTCNLSQSACGPLANVQNYMDYSTCAVMFTQGQAQEMDAALNSTIGGRYYLWQQSNLNATGVNTVPAPACAPIADFGSNAISICAGSTISFRDQTWNATPTAWSWQFPGGSPSSSNDSMPVIQYTSPGNYDVSLTVSSSAGTATLTRTAHINVEAVAATYSSNNFSEGFETSTIPGTDWQVFNLDGGVAWQRTTTAAASGSASAFISGSGNSMYQTDELISPTFNLSQIPSPVMTFKMAFGAWDTEDELEVLISKDCGKTWIVRYRKSGANLITNSTNQTSYIPSASEWRTESVSVLAFASEPNVMFKFRYMYAGGMKLFIDNINVSSNVGMEKLQDEYSVDIYPNPAIDNVVLSFDLPSAQKISACIYNMIGQTVWAQAAQEMKAGQNEIGINTSSFSPGVYMVEISADRGKIIKRLVIK